MSEDLQMINESQSSQSEFQKVKERSQKQYLNQEKIQRFYQAFERLKKFVDQTRFLQLNQNQDLSKYLAKFEKLENQRKNNTFQNKDIINIAKQRVERYEKPLFRMIKSQKPRKNWTIDDRTILDWVVLHFALSKSYKNIEKDFTKQDWMLVASLIPGATQNSCMFKWLSLHKTNLNEASWSEQESDLLKTLVYQYVNANKSIRWKDVCKKLYLLNQNNGKNYRTHKQCKEHWICKLNPNIKRQPWTQEEDILLLTTIKQNSGLKKWVEMVKLFKGRTQNAVKNRYNLIIEKQKKFIQKQKDQLQLIDVYLQRCYVEKFTKILEPDSQQLDPEKQKQTKVKVKKSKKIKKSQNQIINSFQYLQINRNEKKQTGPSQDTEHSSLVKIQRKPHEDTSKHQNNKNQNSIEEYLSIQNLSEVYRYNHRTKDIQFDFMYLDSSMLH